MSSLKIEERGIQAKIANVYTNVRRACKTSSLFYDYWDDLFVKNLNAEANSIILDLGCGTGFLLKRLHEEGYNYLVGLDITLEMLREAKSLLGNTVDLVLADAEKLPFRDRSLDAILCCGTLHHIPQFRKTVSEISRSLKENGILILSETNESLVLKPLRFFLKSSGKFSEAHRAFPLVKLKTVLVENSFSISKQSYFGYLAFALLGFPDILSITRYIPTKIARLLILLDKFLSKTPLLSRFSWHIFIVARLRVP